MSGSVQKTIPEERFFAYREGAAYTQKTAEIFEKSSPFEKTRCKAAGSCCRCRSVAGSCGIRRRELRLAHQNRHKFFACNRFMLVQVFSDFMKLWQVILQKLDRFLVLCFYKVDGQGIDSGSVSQGEQEREESPPRYWFATVSIATISKVSLMP